MNLVLKSELGPKVKLGLKFTLGPTSPFRLKFTLGPNSLLGPTAAYQIILEGDIEVIHPSTFISNEYHYKKHGFWNFIVAYIDGWVYI